MRVLITPDWRNGGPYQAKLADSLSAEGVETVFPAEGQANLSLAAVVKEIQPDIVHLHWPEAYIPLWSKSRAIWETMRFSKMIKKATDVTPLVLTAHNNKIHNTTHHSFFNKCYTSTFGLANAIIVHSEECRRWVMETHAVPATKLHIIPHGDLSDGPLGSKPDSRARLGLSPERRICLVFGRMEPYKGIVPLLEFWKQRKIDADLVVVGAPYDRSHLNLIKSLAENSPIIRVISEHVPDATLSDWLSACDAVIFNYSSIFTSGAACLTRSVGIPTLLPSHVTTLDLLEPSPRVFRFSSLDEIEPALNSAFAIGSDYESAADYRSATAWPKIARKTKAVYRELLKGK